MARAVPNSRFPLFVPRGSLCARDSSSRCSLCTRYSSSRCSLCTRYSSPPARGRLFLRCRRPGSEFVDEVNVLCRRGLPPVPHCARTLPKTPLLCHFPKNARFRQYGSFRTPAKPGVSEGGFWRFGFQTPLFHPATAADCNFATLMSHFVPPARQGGLTAFCRGGFAVFDGEMLSKRCFSSALFPIPNYFYEIVAKIVRVVIK